LPVLFRAFEAPSSTVDLDREHRSGVSFRSPGHRIAGRLRARCRDGATAPGGCDRRI